MATTKTGNGQGSLELELHERLRRERRSRNWTQAQAAEPFSVTQQTYSRWEAGQTRPVGHEKELAKFLRITQKDAAVLVAGKGVPTPEQATVDELSATVDTLGLELKAVRALVARLLERLDLADLENGSDARELPDGPTPR